MASAGALAVSSWIRLPPRDTLKLGAMLVSMLDDAGVEEPGQHLAVIRGWQMATFVVTHAPLTAAMLDGLREFIYTGAEGGMPHWGLEGLKYRDVDAVARFILDRLTAN